MSIIVFFKTGNLDILSTGFKYVTYIASAFVGIQMISDRASDLLNNKEKKNE